MYTKEINKLKAHLTPGMLDLLKEEKAFIAGGALTSIFTNQQVNDIDIYVRSPQSLLRIVNEAVSTDREFLAKFELIVNNKSDKSISCKLDREQDLQLIYFKFFDSAQAVFDTFDFTINMCAYACETEQLIMHPNFLKHCSQRHLSINPKTAYPLISVMRINKYAERGFTISKKELMKLLSCVTALKLDSWEAANEQMGSMYGCLDLTPEGEQQAFSLERLWWVLDNIAEHKITTGSVTTGGVETIWSSLVSQFCGEDTSYKYKYFKYVSDQYKSPASYYAKLDYTPGNIVNGGEHGIYFTNYGNKSTYYSEGRKAISLIPQDDCRIEGDRMIGDVLVDKDITDLVPSGDFDIAWALENIKPQYKDFEKPDIAEHEAWALEMYE